jgi:hypothetical protein
MFTDIFVQIHTVNVFKAVYIIQGDAGGNVSILGGDTIGHCKKRSSYEDVSNSEWLAR